MDQMTPYGSGDDPSRSPSRSRPPAANADARIPELRVGERVDDYVIRRRLGAGGMGQVYEADDPRLRRSVAIKIVSMQARGVESESKSRFRDEISGFREAQILASISHPNVVPVFDVGTLAGLGCVYLAMERIDGVTLRDWLEASPRSWREVAEIIARVGEGIEALHTAGLVHGDIKTQNVMVADDGRVMIIDFGLARESGPGPLLSQSQSSHGGSGAWRESQRSRLSGTIPYMTPEMLQGASATESSDCYALCVCLHEALFDCRPFPEGRLRHPWLEPTIGGERASPRSVPRRLRRLLERTLATEPARREADVAYVVAQLRSLLNSRRRRWRAGGLAVMAVSGVLGAAVLDSTVSTKLGGPCLQSLKETSAELERRQTESFRELANVAENALLVETLALTRDTFSERIDAWQSASDQLCRRLARTSNHDSTSDDDRRLCLEDHRRQSLAFLDLIADGDAQTLARSTATLQLMASVEGCDEGARDTGARPRRLSLQVPVERARARLASIRVMVFGGAYERAQTQLVQLLVGARELGFEPLTAEIEYLLGRVYEHQSKIGPARERMQRALVLAKRHDENELVARVASRLLNIDGLLSNRDVDLDALRNAARSALLRAGNVEHVRVDWLWSNASAAFRQGDHPRIVRLLEQAIELESSRPGGSAHKVMLMRNDLAIAYGELGHIDDATRLFELAIAEGRAKLGPAHPDLSYPLGSYGELLLALGRFASARDYLRRAEDVIFATLGPDTPTNVWACDARSRAEGELGAYEVAQQRYSSCRRRQPAEDAYLSDPESYSTWLALQRGDVEGARAGHARSLAALAADPPVLGFQRQLIYMQVAGNALALGDAAQATALLDRAEPAVRERNARRPDVLAEFDLLRARAATAKRDFASARIELARASAILRSFESRTGRIAAEYWRVDAELARAQGDAGREGIAREKVVELLSQREAAEPAALVGPQLALVRVWVELGRTERARTLFEAIDPAAVAERGGRLRDRHSRWIAHFRLQAP